MRARTCARPCHQAGGELEQIQFLLGHMSVQTTERYPGVQAADSYNWLLCLVNRLHSFFIHPATVHFDFRESSFD
jgi:site-specific recombinase XerD